MNMIKVSSSQINAIGYDQAERVLVVQFNSGSTYLYRDVPPEVYEGLLDAESVGRYFGANVIGVFACEKQPSEVIS